MRDTLQAQHALGHMMHLQGARRCCYECIFLTIDEAAGKIGGNSCGSGTARRLELVEL